MSIVVNKDELLMAIEAAEALVRSLKALKKSAFPGWSVYRSGGYGKASRRVGKKVQCVHLGRWPIDPAEIKKRISEFELKVEAE